MTSKLTRERIELIANFHRAMALPPSHAEIEELARMALAAMDSEPVAEVLSNRPGNDTSTIDRALPVGTQLYRHAQPAPVVPEKCPAEIRDLISSDTDALFNDDDAQEIWNACRAAMLKAQPQNAPQNIPEIIPGWIPVSEQKPDCWCRTCRPVTLNDMRFVVCPDCGNKRCPRANDHRNACTGSNEPGQEGSAYPDTPREVK
ncbi:TPA: hypothetical protein ACWXAD_004972 [Klebsiella quasipneumoniae subsp. similipneumoniae]